MNNARPVFFTGQMRSGGTLLTRIFDQSDELRVAYDTVHYMRFGYKKYEPIKQNYEKLLMDINERLNCRWNMSINVESIKDVISKLKTIDEARVYDAIMKSFLNITDTDKNIRWGDRTAVRWEGIRPFLELFPQGKVVHIYRDPRAVLASYKHMTYLKKPMYLDVIFSTLAMFNCISSLNSCVNVYLVKYENLVDKPEETVRDMCQFLDIKFSRKMLDVTRFKDFKGHQFSTDSSFTEQKNSIDTSSKDLWKDKLTNIDIYLTEMILKHHMKLFGYELSGIDLAKDEWIDFYELLHDKYVYKRYSHWLKNGDGIESHPDTYGAYE